MAMIFYLGAKLQFEVASTLNNLEEKAGKMLRSITVLFLNSVISTALFHFEPLLNSKFH
jgi:hypothetical protein